MFRAFSEHEQRKLAAASRRSHTFSRHGLDGVSVVKRLSHTELAERLALSLPPREREAFRLVQVRLARALARLWEVFAELLESHQALTSRSGSPVPVEPADFRPGNTLHIQSSFVQTDPRLVLAERLNIDSWPDLIGELAEAVLRAPELARMELLTVLGDLDEGVLAELSAQLGGEEAATEEFPVQPRREET